MILSSQTKSIGVAMQCWVPLIGQDKGKPATRLMKLRDIP